MSTERTLLLALALIASSCGPNLKDLSRGMAQEAEARESRPAAPDRQRTYFNQDLERPRTEVELLILWDGRSVQHGVERAWFPSGALRHERSFVKGEPKGWWRTWYEDGTLRSENEIDPESATLLRWWHPGGQLSSEGNARNSLRVGPWRGWHPNGNTAYEGDYRLGVRHGPWSFWHESGELAERGVYREGKRIGSWEMLPDAKPQEPDAEGAPLEDQ